MSAPKTYVLDPFYVIGSICNSYLFLYLYVSKCTRYFFLVVHTSARSYGKYLTLAHVLSENTASV